MSMTFDALETVASQTHSQEEIDALTTDDTVPPVAHLNWVFRKIGRGDKHKPKSNKDGKVDAQVLSNQEKERVLLTLSRWVAECEDDIISENLWPPIIESIPIVSAGCHISVASSFAGLLVRKSAANDQTTSAPSIPKQHLPSLLSIVSSVLLSSDEGASLAWMDLMSQILDLDPEGDIHIGDIVDLILQKSEVFESSPIKIATSRLCASLLRFIAAKMDLYPKHKDLAFEKEFSIDRELDKALESSESGKDGQSTSNSKDSRDRPDGDAVAPHFEELILSFPSFESDNTQSMFYPNHHTLPPLYRLSVSASSDKEQSRPSSSVITQPSGSISILQQPASYLPLPNFVSLSPSSPLLNEPMSLPSFFGSTQFPDISDNSVLRKNNPEPHVNRCLEHSSFANLSPNLNTSPGLLLPFTALCIPSLHQSAQLHSNSKSTSQPSTQTHSLITSLLARVVTLLSDPDPSVILSVLSHSPPTDPALASFSSLYSQITNQNGAPTPFSLSHSTCVVDIACWVAGSEWTAKSIVPRLITIINSFQPKSTTTTRSKDDKGERGEREDTKTEDFPNVGQNAIMILLQRTATLCLARICCCLRKDDRDRVLQMLIKRISSTVSNDKKDDEKRKEEAKDDEQPRKRDEDDQSRDDWITGFVLVRPLGHFLMSFYGFEHPPVMKKTKGSKGKETETKRDREEKEATLTTIHTFLTFFRQTVTIALRFPSSPSSSPLITSLFALLPQNPLTATTTYSLLSDCVYALPTMVRFGSFLRYSCLLPSCLAPQTNAFSSSLPTHMLPSPALLNSTSPFLHTLILSILGCEKEDVIRQLAVSLPFILSHQGLLMEKEEKDKDRKLELAEKEKRKDDKSLDAFLTSDTKFPFSRLDGCPVALRRRLLASVQQVSSKEREKEADRLGSMVVRIVEKLLVVASNQPTGNLLSSFVSLLPAMVGKCHLTADQHSTIASALVSVTSRVSRNQPLTRLTPPTLPNTTSATSTTPSQHSSLSPSLSVSPSQSVGSNSQMGIVQSWRSSVLLNLSLIHLLPLFSQFHLLSSLLPFFLSFTHTAPSNLALSSAFCFARTLRSVRQKRFRTQIVSSLIHSLAHSSSPKHKHTFLTLAASFFLCFSKRWCKVALLQSLGELLGDTNRSVANRARLFLPIIRTMLVLPQDQNFLPLLASSTPPLSTIPSQPSLPPSSKTVKKPEKEEQKSFSRTNSKHDVLVPTLDPAISATLFVGFPAAVDARLQNEEDEMEMNENDEKTKDKKEREDRELKELDLTRVMSSVFSSFVSTCKSTVEIVHSSFVPPSPEPEREKVVKEIKVGKEGKDKEKEKEDNKVESKEGKDDTSKEADTEPTRSALLSSFSLSSSRPSILKGGKKTEGTITLSDGTRITSMLSSLHPSLNNAPPLSPSSSDDVSSSFNSSFSNPTQPLSERTVTVHIEDKPEGSLQSPTPIISVPPSTIPTSTRSISHPSSPSTFPLSSSSSFNSPPVSQTKLPTIGPSAPHILSSHRPLFHNARSPDPPRLPQSPHSSHSSSTLNHSRASPSPPPNHRLGVSGLHKRTLAQSQSGDIPPLHKMEGTAAVVPPGSKSTPHIALRPKSKRATFQRHKSMNNLPSLYTNPISQFHSPSMTGSPESTKVIGLNTSINSFSSPKHSLALPLSPPGHQKGSSKSSTRRSSLDLGTKKKIAQREEEKKLRKDSPLKEDPQRSAMRNMPPTLPPLTLQFSPLPVPNRQPLTPTSHRLPPKSSTKTSPTSKRVMSPKKPS